MPASSLVRPLAIETQNRLYSSRRAAGGRPGEPNGARPDLLERRFRVVIASSFVEVLRRPLESAQYCSLEYQAVLKKHGIAISMSGKGNCFDCENIGAAW